MRRFLTILAMVLMPGICFGASILKHFRVSRMTEATGVMRTTQFGWQIESESEDIMQTAYRICVATSKEGIQTDTRDRLWDSERVESQESIQVPYQGRKLPSQKDIYWQVTVWLNNGECIKSPIQKFITGIQFAEWQAEWIGLGKVTDIITDEEGCRNLPARYLRKEFSVTGKPRRAILYLSGMGVSSTYINGQSVSDEVMGTLPSEYNKTVYYNTYDVTHLIRKGKNAIATVLGNGYVVGLRKEHTSYGLPRLKAQLLIETDRDTMVIPTSDQWRATAEGPIRSNNLYSGELYDARREQKGWNEPGFDDSTWEQAKRMDHPKGMLHPQPSPGIRTQERLKAKSIHPTADGRYIVDMGQNMVGQLQVTLKGKAGQPVVIRHAERLSPEHDDVLYTANLRSAKCTNTYIPAQDGLFTYHPQLVYQGFRYVEISGITAKPALQDIVGLVQYNGMDTQGDFSCDDSLLNQLYKNAYWGIRGNYQGIPVDCPQRDERLGWTGDRVTGCYGENMLFDNATLYFKWLKDMEDTQKENGQISDVCPAFLGIYSNNVTWQAAFVYATYMLFSHCADMQAAMTYYPALRRWTQYVERNLMHEGVVTHDVYGDWCMPPAEKEVINSKDSSRITEATVLSTTVYYDCLRMMAEMGERLGLEADATYYRRQMRRMKDAYNEKMFHTATAQYSNNTVTANILSLALGLVPQGYEEQVMQNITDVIKNKYEEHVSCGVLGMQHLMRTLTRKGQTDLAMKIVRQRTYPSYGYMIDHGATTIWELWNGDTANPAMNSGNHVMLLGDLLLWYYEDLAGIRQEEGTQGYRHLDMKPCFPEELHHVSASYRSVSGLIRSEWTKQDKHLTWTIEIPANTQARISIPNRFNVFPATGKGVHTVKEEMGYTVIEVGSGTYKFQSDI